MKQKLKDEILKEVKEIFGITIKMQNWSILEDSIKKAINLTQEKTLKEFSERLIKRRKVMILGVIKVEAVEVKDIDKTKKELKKKC